MKTNLIGNVVDTHEFKFDRKVLLDVLKKEGIKKPSDATFTALCKYFAPVEDYLSLFDEKHIISANIEDKPYSNFVENGTVILSITVYKVEEVNFNGLRFVRIAKIRELKNMDIFVTPCGARHIKIGDTLFKDNYGNFFDKYCEEDYNLAYCNMSGVYMESFIPLNEGYDAKKFAMDMTKEEIADLEVLIVDNIIAHPYPNRVPSSNGKNK